MSVVWTACTAVEDHRLRPSLLVIGAGLGVVFGLTSARQTRRERLRTSSITAGLSVAQRRAVVQAADTGAGPEDPALHSASVALARDAFDRELRTHEATIAVVAVLVAISLLLAWFDSWWYLVSTAVFVAALVRAFRAPARLRRRLTALEAA